jgi:hypothetical protein
MQNLLKNSVEKLDIKSKYLTLSMITENRELFNIPVYQRLYVWGTAQIKTLLEDLQRSFDENSSSEYYLGAIMVSKNNDKFDLIDGQQRFTTLWLISKVLGYKLEDFIHEKSRANAIPRISFSVREFANRYFEGKNNAFSKIEEEELKNIDQGLATIQEFVNNIDSKRERIEDYKKKFASFIFENVKMVATEMPLDTDENKVFESMNNRGVQLQQHEILKSRLLSVIKDNNLRRKYSLIWDACSIMDNYLEKNIKDVAGLTWKQLFPEDVSDGVEKTNQLPSLDDILETLSKSQNEEKNSLTLTTIIDDNIGEKSIDTKDDLSDYDSGKVRSIISFPMLLLHTLRIFQYEYFEEEKDSEEFSAEVKGKELIRIFDSYKESHFYDEERIITFLELLWKVRLGFDQFVIKWSLDIDGHTEIHTIKKLYQSKTTFQRKSPETNEGFALLQSMLYHSQQLVTHYWLTPFLHTMLDEDDAENLYEYLLTLDNSMFCSPKEDLRVLSYKMMKRKGKKIKGNVTYVENELRSSKGTSFPSYWFYKLEFILWKNKSSFVRKNWDNYRITAKNSVEHISPQNPREYDSNPIWDDTDTEEERNEKLNDFGNLVLLTSSMNSEYSSKTYNQKRTDFGEKKRLDSLKSDLIFSKDIWNWNECKDHRNEMINLFTNHIKNH